jgi:hypothetical protein
MNALAPITQANTLPAMVRSAASKLAKAETAAEVLEARDTARMVYDAAKSTARLAKAKSAHDEVISAVYHAQADALDIESAAKRRLADEYDAAQDRGEVARNGQPSSSMREGLATAAEIGLTHKDIHEARLIRDAEEADPGVVRRTLDRLLDEGEEPTRAAIKREIAAKVEPRVNDSSLWLWGRLRDFDAKGITDIDPATLLFGMTEPMRADVRRLAPIVREFLEDLEIRFEPA